MRCMLKVAGCAKKLLVEKTFGRKIFRPKKNSAEFFFGRKNFRPKKFSAENFAVRIAEGGNDGGGPGAAEASPGPPE